LEVSTVQRVVCAGLLAAFCGFAADVLTGFQTSRIKSAHGAVSQVEFATPLIELEADVLAHHMPHAMMHFRFAEPVWVVAYETEILDAQGKTPLENHLCHTFFGDQRVMQSESQEIRGLYSDAFTPAMKLPDGFGVHMAAEETLHWMPMFNNRGPDPFRVRMKVRLTVIRDKDVTQPLRPLYSTLRSVQVPHLYFVKPGRDERGADFKLPYEARIHFMGTHIHPYGVSVELTDVTRGKRIWLGARQANDSGRMETFSSAEGYLVPAGSALRVSAIYDNPTKAPVDAMAGIYLLYSR
jgi:hypothetical protein